MTRAFKPVSPLGLITSTVIVSGSGPGVGVFVYSPSPGLGNLIQSLTSATSDPYGNKTVQGMTSYNDGAGLAIALQGDGLTVFSGHLATGWTAQGSIIGDSTGDLLISPAGAGVALFTGPASFTGGTVTVSAQHLNLTAGAVESIVATLINGDLLTVQNQQAAPNAPSVQLIAQAAADLVLGIDISTDTINRFAVDSNGKHTWGPGGNTARDTDLFRGAAGVLQTDSTLAITNQAAPAVLAGAAQLYAASGQPAYENPQGLTANLSGGQLSTVNVNTVTQAAFTNLASASIPAADAVVGATYKLTVFGYGTWGSTQQQLTLGARFGAAATNTVGVTPAIAATALAASAAFQWKAEVIAVCVTTGAAGTWRVSVSGIIAETANALLPGTAADNSIPFAAGTGSSDITLDTTVAETLGLSAKWAATTGAPTISKTVSTFERIA